MKQTFIVFIFTLIIIAITPIHTKALSYEYEVFSAYPKILKIRPYKAIIVWVEFIRFKDSEKIQRIVYALIPNNGKSTLGDRGFPIEILDWKGGHFSSKTLYRMNINQVYYLLEKLGK